MGKKDKKEVAEHTVETIKLSEHNKIQISTFKYKGEDEVHVNVRKFYRTKNDKTWKPARQGITFPLEVAKKMRVKMKTVTEQAEEGEGIEVISKKGRDE